jgi:3-deoxy-manno-octulosonate cytidylyltransferase (CMP-KDO synthetase)
MNIPSRVSRMNGQQKMRATLAGTMKNPLKIFLRRYWIIQFAIRERIYQYIERMVKMKIIAIIPARYASTRFPGKPLAEICGKPMIWWVYQQAKKVTEFAEIYVATESNIIVETCKQHDIQVVMTSDKHPTGTDRVAEAAEKIKADLYVNIQGDEPMIEPETIRSVITPFLNGEDIHVSNLMTKITDPVDALNPTVPKVIANADGRGIYVTRSLSPFPKGNINYSFYKQVCAYAFTPWALDFFKFTPRGQVEQIEDIEILRFIENGIPIKYTEVSSDSVAVDTPIDLEKVRSLLNISP